MWNDASTQPFHIIAASGWKAAGSLQTRSSGPNAGKRVVFVREPDLTTIEFMQPPPVVPPESSGAT